MTSPETSDVQNLEFEKIESESKDEENTPLKYDISIFPADYTLEVLYQKWNNEEIVIPKFQRGFVWTITQASRLIESFMMGLPIPPVFFYIQPDEKYLVIDGRQRLESIFYFFNGVFREPDASNKQTIFKLEGINGKNPLYKKRFQDFEESDKRRLKNSILRVILVKQLRPNDGTSIYHIFERLNTGGTSLIDQEVRNCVYAGKLNDLLLELNSYEKWRLVLGKPKTDARQNDVQLILRYLALYYNEAKYQKPMKDFLSEFMSERKNPSEDFINEVRMRFKNTCDLLVQHLGERPFNPKGPLNPSVFDSIFVVFSRHLNSIPNDIHDRFKTLRDDVNFKNLTSKATTDHEVVHNRITVAETILFG